MSAIANIVINDAAATPVAHTFSPAGIKGDTAYFEDRSGGISIGYPKISITSMAPKAVNGLYKARYRVVLPVLETISGTASNGFSPAPQLAYSVSFDGVFICPARSTQQNRKDALAFVKNLLANSLAAAVVTDNDVIY